MINRKIQHLEYDDKCLANKRFCCCHNVTVYYDDGEITDTIYDGKSIVKRLIEIGYTQPKIPHLFRFYPFKYQLEEDYSNSDNNMNNNNMNNNTNNYNNDDESGIPLSNEEIDDIVNEVIKSIMNTDVDEVIEVIEQNIEASETFDDTDNDDYNDVVIARKNNYSDEIE